MKLFQRILSVMMMPALVIGLTSLHLLPVGAAWESSSSDVKISIEESFSDEYRYCFDVEYRDMIFTYALHSITLNVMTNERDIHEGEWVMGGEATCEVSLTVINHADTPISLRATVDDGDFTACGSDVVTDGFAAATLDACRFDGNGQPILGESELALTVQGDPEIESYRGEKNVYITVCATPMSGVATGGQVFRSPFD